MTILVGTDVYVDHGDAYIYHDQHGNTVWTSKYKTITSIVEHSYGILVTTLENHGFVIGDSVTLVETVNYNITGSVMSSESDKTFTVSLTYVAIEYSGYVGSYSDIKSVEIALRKATEWIDNHPNYKGNWKGNIASISQTLSHPRTGLYDEEGRSISSLIIASQIEEACCIMANKIIEDSEDIFPDISSSTSNLKRKKIDTIEKEWFSPSTSALRKKYDKVDQLLKSLTSGFGGYKRIERGY